MKVCILVFLFYFPVVTLANCDWAMELAPVSGGIENVCVDGYMVGYDKKRKQPSWSLYRLNPEHLLIPVKFRVGFDTPKHIDVSHAFDRTFYYQNDMDYAHLAPEKQVVDRSQIPARFSRVNRIGMYAEFNRENGLWWLAEKYETKAANSRYGVIGLSGALPGEGPEDVDYFFKVLIYPNMQSTIAFLLPHSKRRGEKLEDYITSIACIEQLTGYKIFNSLQRYSDIRGDNAFSMHVWTQGDQIDEGCEIGF